jgi:hypothetical protein
MAFDIIFSATFAGGGPGGGGSGGGLAVPAAWFTEWDWDETAVASWDTDITVGTQAGLVSAIETAMGQGTTAAPRYHRIRWTGGHIAGNLDLTGVTAPLPDFFGPHILVQSTDWTRISGSVVTGASLSNVLFEGFEFRTSGGFGTGWFAPSPGNGRRLAMAGCRGGGHPDYANLAHTQFPEVWTGSNGRGWHLTIRDCTIRGMSQIVDGYAGLFLSLKRNFITGLRDDVVAQSVRGVAPFTNHLYAVGNVVCDYNDDPADNPFHCDFVQQGVPQDGANDEYFAQAYGNIVIGDTWRQYPVMAAIIQQEGASRRHQLDWRDNVILGTGTRGHWQPDRRIRIERNMYLWPPLGGAVPTTGTGWNGGPYRQAFRSTGTLGTDADIAIGLYWAAEGANNAAGWASLPGPAQIVSHTAGLGGATSYDTRFPNMTGLAYQGATLVIDNGYASVARNAQAMRDWISHTYRPHTAAQGIGWAENGFNDPAGWFA